MKLWRCGKDEENVGFSKGFKNAFNASFLYVHCGASSKNAYTTLNGSNTTLVFQLSTSNIATLDKCRSKKHCLTMFLKVIIDLIGIKLKS